MYWNIKARYGKEQDSNCECTKGGFYLWIKQIWLESDVSYLSEFWLPATKAVYVQSIDWIVAEKKNSELNFVPL